MSFSPNLFLSNMSAKDGPAKPSRFEVILPIPPYVNEAVGNSIIEKILNFPNSVIGDVSDAFNRALGRGGNEGNDYSKTSNAALSRDKLQERVAVIAFAVPLASSNLTDPCWPR